MKIGFERDILEESRVDDEKYTMQSCNFTDEYARKKAERLGCDIVYGNDNTLLLDIDNEEDLHQFDKQYALLNEHVEMGLPVITASRSGNKHISIKLTQPVSLMERIALQTALGSDRKRELLSILGFRAGQENPVLLFKPRGTDVKS
jgi:hypothetical protein